jgi:hypothetical protein
VVGQARLDPVADGADPAAPQSGLLFKGAPSKGLGVLVADPYTAAISPADPGLPWLLALNIFRGRDLVVTDPARERRPRGPQPRVTSSEGLPAEGGEAP